MGVDEGINGALFLFDAMQHMSSAIHLLIKQVDGKSPQFACTQRKVGGDVEFSFLQFRCERISTNLHVILGFLCPTNSAIDDVHGDGSPLVDGLPRGQRCSSPR